MGSIEVPRPYTPSERERAVARISHEAGLRGASLDDAYLQLAAVLGDPGAPEPAGILQGEEAGRNDFWTMTNAELADWLDYPILRCKGVSGDTWRSGMTEIRDRLRGKLPDQGEESGRDELSEKIRHVAADLVARQKSLDPDARVLLYRNLWDLYTGDPTGATEVGEAEPPPANDLIALVARAYELGQQTWEARSMSAYSDTRAEYRAMLARLRAARRIEGWAIWEDSIDGDGDGYTVVTFEIPHDLPPFDACNATLILHAPDSEESP